MAMSDDPKVRQAAWDRMGEHLAGGGRIVIGSEEPLGITWVVGKTTSGKTLTILSRSTREAFEEFMPLLGTTRESVDAYLRQYRPPFYYELELWDHVVDDGAGGSIGFRIKKAGYR